MGLGTGDRAGIHNNRSGQKGERIGGRAQVARKASRQTHTHTHMDRGRTGQTDTKEHRVGSDVRVEKLKTLDNNTIMAER